MKLNTGLVTGAIMTIIIIMILFKVYTAIVPEAQDAGNELNASNQCEAVGCGWNQTAGACRTNATGSILTCPRNYGEVPLNSLFASAGVVFFIVMAALVVWIIKSLLHK